VEISKEARLKMSFAYRSIKTTFRSIIPHHISTQLFDGRSALSKAILALKSKMERAASHDEIYDKAYYDNYTEEMERSAVGIVNSIVKHLRPSSAIDIGCGSGEVLKQMCDRGIDARGADLSEAALNYCRSKGLLVEKLDLENVAAAPNWSADTVISLEVAEHLPENVSDHYVSTLISMSRSSIVITAAPPGQGGTDHVNEQPHEYWIDKFSRTGAVYDYVSTEVFRREWLESGVESSRARNVLVFRKA
jgi:cyclopropane fatty-acyl-phospholipid synthase-like methyltransferase